MWIRECGLGRWVRHALRLAMLAEPGGLVSGGLGWAFWLIACPPAVKVHPAWSCAAMKSCFTRAVQTKWKLLFFSFRSTWM